MSDSTDAISITKLRELADFLARQQLDESPASPTVDPVFAARDSGYRAGRNDGMRYAAKALRVLIERGGLAFVVFLFLGCAVNDPDRYTVTWNTPTVIDGSHEYPITCGDISAHPCPLATHATEAVITADSITWAHVIAMDANGNDLADATELAAITIGDDGSLVIASGGDDGGLRTIATLAPTDDGWSGPVTWDLTAIAGTTTFRLDVSR